MKLAKLNLNKQIIIGTVAGLGLLFILAVPMLKGSGSDFPDDTVLTLQLQADGKAVLGGKFGNGKIMRRNPDGSLDTSFTASWTSDGFNDVVNTLAIQTDQKILVGGRFTRFDVSLAGGIARLNSDGSFDENFSRATGVGFDDEVTSIGLQPDGKIWAVGKFSAFNGITSRAIARINPDGSLDQSLQMNYSFDPQPLTLRVVPDLNKVIVIGERLPAPYAIQFDGKAIPLGTEP